MNRWLTISFYLIGLTLLSIGAAIGMDLAAGLIVMGLGMMCGVLVIVGARNL